MLWVISHTDHEKLFLWRQNTVVNVWTGTKNDNRGVSYWHNAAFSDEWRRFYLDMHNRCRRVRCCCRKQRNHRLAVKRQVHRNVWNIDLAFACGSQSLLLFVGYSITSPCYVKVCHINYFTALTRWLARQTILVPILYIELRTVSKKQMFIFYVTTPLTRFKSYLTSAGYFRSPDFAIGNPQKSSCLQRSASNLDNLIFSMPRRVQEYTQLRGCQPY